MVDVTHVLSSSFSIHSSIKNQEVQNGSLINADKVTILCTLNLNFVYSSFVLNKVYFLILLANIFYFLYLIWFHGNPMCPTLTHFYLSFFFSSGNCYLFFHCIYQLSFSLKFQLFQLPWCEKKFVSYPFRLENSQYTPNRFVIKVWSILYYIRSPSMFQTHKLQTITHLP